MYLALACEKSDVLSVISFIKTIMNTICTLVPIVLIVMVSIDLLKIVINGDDNTVKTSTKTIINRVIGAVAVFFVPTIVALVLGSIENFTSDYSVCWDSATSENIKFYRSLEKLEEQEQKEANKKKKELATKEREELNTTRENLRKKAYADAKKKEEAEKNNNSGTDTSSVPGKAQSYKDVNWDTNDVTKISNLSSDQLKKVLNSYGGKAKNFAPYASNYIKTEQKYGINVFFIIGLEAQESTWLTSKAAVRCNNLGGVMKTPRCMSGSKLAKFSSKGDFINYQGDFLKRLYINQGLKSIPKIQKKYCQSGCFSWVSNVEKIGNKLFNQVKKIM